MLFHSRWTPGISGYFAERTYKPPLSLNSANKFHENPTKSPYPRASKDFRQNNFKEKYKCFQLIFISSVCQRLFLKCFLIQIRSKTKFHCTMNLSSLDLNPDIYFFLDLDQDISSHQNLFRCDSSLPLSVRSHPPKLRHSFFLLPTKDFHDQQSLLQPILVTVFT